MSIPLAGEKQIKPLAERMRPRCLVELKGQEQVLAPGSPLFQLLEKGQGHIPSMILWGPPGTGKTTIARLLAESAGYRFCQLSGVLDGLKEFRQAIDDAQRALEQGGRRTLALVDEIHRFNKTQQDAFLPHVESGLLTIVGQTTENVSFRIRGALLSRLRVVRLVPLSENLLEEIIDQALMDSERGLGESSLSITPEARKMLANWAMGDARRALTALEWAALSLADSQKERVISADLLRRTFEFQGVPYDQDGDYRYDCISAFIKSMRGSDPDAALYYMVRALEGGEDPLYLSRRMIVFAAEDASCDPRALQVALDVDRAVERVGMPEAEIPLANGVVYLSTCAKSNAAYLALKEIKQVVRQHPHLEIPARLKNAPTTLMKELGNSLGYRYPHDFPQSFVPERYLPREIENLEVYRPSDRALEAQISERLSRFRQLIAEQRKTQ